MLSEDLDKVEANITRKGPEQKAGFTVVLIQQGGMRATPKEQCPAPCSGGSGGGAPPPRASPLEEPPHHPTLVAILGLLH